MNEYEQELFRKFWQGEAGPLRRAGVLLDKDLTEWNVDGIRALAEAAFLYGRATCDELNLEASVAGEY